MLSIYETLFDAYGPQGWWPVTPAGKVAPVYGYGCRTPVHQFEIAAGALLTQNTAWKNVEKALIAMHEANIYSPGDVVNVSRTMLAQLIRPAGYHNQKAERLQLLAHYFCKTPVLAKRQNLLALKGVGPETADSILLYAFEQSYFVIDAYTRRIFSRLGFLHEDASYDEWQCFFQANLPQEAGLFQEYHALLVEHAKRFCKKKPACGMCVLQSVCKKQY